jgi:predicted metal-binding protein
MYPRLEEPVEKRWFTHTPKYIKDQCFRIYNEIENSFYSYKDVVAFLIYESLWHDDVKLPEVNSESINKFKAIFTEEQLLKDRRMIDKINKQANLKDIKEYFFIRENGESLIYRLCMQKIVSIYFFAYYANSFLTGFFEKCKLKERHGAYRRFDETVKNLIDKLNLQTFSIKNERDV